MTGMVPEFVRGARCPPWLNVVPLPVGSAIPGSSCEIPNRQPGGGSFRPPYYDVDFAGARSTIGQMNIS
jgi:hypothetical protein